MIGLFMAIALCQEAPKPDPAPAGSANDQSTPAYTENQLQRRRVMTLVREGDCPGALGAVFVMGDAEMFDLVESQCPVAVSDLERWERHYGSGETPWDGLPAVTPAPKASTSNE